MILFLFVLLILAFVFEGLTLSGGLKKLRYSYKLDTLTTEPDTPLHFITTVTNNSIVPVTYFGINQQFPLDADLPDRLEIVAEDRLSKTASDTYRLWGRRSMQRIIPVTLHKRGVHFFSHAEMIRGDFLGISQSREIHEQSSEVFVYPRTVENDTVLDALGNYCGELIASQHLISDPVLTRGVREYTGREPMHTISWSQTARRGELMVREFDFTREISCNLIVATNGLGALDFALFDYMCSLARTVCENLAEKGIQLSMHTNAPVWGYRTETLWSCRADRTHMGDVLETLARMEPGFRCPLQPFIAECMRREGPGTAFILIVPYDTPEVHAAVEMLRNYSGMDCMPIIASETFEEVKA